MRNIPKHCVYCIIFLTFWSAVGTVAAQEGRDALELYRQGRYEEAVQVCRQELAVQPRRMDAHVVLGWSLLRLERYEDALQSAQEAHSIVPGDYRIIEILAEAHFFLGNNLEALEEFQEYTVLAPTGDRIDLVYYYMGEIFIRLGEFNHADIAFTTAVYHSPNTARWWARLGYAREMAKDYEYAIIAYDQALTLNPSYSEARRGKERVLEKMETG